MRLVLLTAVLALAALGASPASSGPTPSVTCEDVSGVGADDPSWTPKRVVLGAVAVPPAYMGQIQRRHEGRWTYWRKAGLVVRAGSPPVFVSVPREWRPRAGQSAGAASARPRSSGPRACR